MATVSAAPGTVTSAPEMTSSSATGTGWTLSAPACLTIHTLKMWRGAKAGVLPDQSRMSNCPVSGFCATSANRVSSASVNA